MTEKDSLNEFLSSTSLHGVRFLAHPSKRQKVIWGCCLLMCFLYLCYTISKYFQYFQTTYMRTEIEMILAKKEGLAVPTLTLCSLNQFKRSKLEKNPELQHIVENMYNNSFEEDTTVFGAYQTWLERQNATEYADFLTDLREASDTPWVFKIRFRNAGIRFHGRNDTRNLFKRVYIKDKVCIDLNVTYLAEIREEERLLFTRSGNHHALQLFLFTNRSEETVGNAESNGVSVVIHDPEEKPGLDLLDKGIFVAPNTAVYVGLTKSTLKINTYKTRGKPSKNEYELCRLDCWISLIAKYCDCIWDNRTDIGYYDYGNVSRMCETASDWSCMRITDEFSLEEMDSNENVCNRCYFPSVESSYEAFISTAQFPTRYLKESYLQANHTHEDLDYIMISIYMQDVMEKITEIEEIDGISAFLSDLGGAMGLLAGASVLTVIEIIQFALIRIYKFIQQCRKKKSNGFQKGTEMSPVPSD